MCCMYAVLGRSPCAVGADGSRRAATGEGCGARGGVCAWCVRSCLSRGTSAMSAHPWATSPVCHLFVRVGYASACAGPGRCVEVQDFTSLHVRCAKPGGAMTGAEP